MFLLDTNIVILVLNESNPTIARRLDAELEKATPILLSAIVLYELRFGIANGARRARNEAALAQFLTMPLDLLSFDGEDADHAADIRAALKRAARPIGPYDILIAAQSRRRGAVLVTLNRREFERVPGLMVTDWAA
ncbi:MAG: type II toxin-antitoxin system VapC family toxin [Hyphomicrobiales bacterium]